MFKLPSTLNLPCFACMRDALGSFLVWAAIMAIALGLFTELGWLPKDLFTRGLFEGSTKEPVKELTRDDYDPTPITLYPGSVAVLKGHSKVRAIDLPHDASALQITLSADEAECYIRDRYVGRDITIVYELESSGEYWDSTWHLDHCCPRVIEVLETLVIDEQLRELGMDIDAPRTTSTVQGTLEKRHLDMEHSGSHGLVTAAGGTRDFQKARYCRTCTKPNYWEE